MSLIEKYSQYRRPSDRVLRRQGLSRVSQAINDIDNNHVGDHGVSKLQQQSALLSLHVSQTTPLLYSQIETPLGLHIHRKSKASRDTLLNQWNDATEGLREVHEINTSTHGAMRLAGNLYAEQLLLQQEIAAHYLIHKKNDKKPTVDEYGNSYALRNFHGMPMLTLPVMSETKPVSFKYINTLPEHVGFALLLRASLLHVHEPYLKEAIQINTSDPQSVTSSYPEVVGAELYEMGEAYSDLISNTYTPPSQKELQHMSRHARGIHSYMKHLKQDLHRFTSRFYESLFDSNQPNHDEAVSICSNCFAAEPIVHARALELAGLADPNALYDAYRRCHEFIQSGDQSDFFRKLRNDITKKVDAPFIDEDGLRYRNIVTKKRLATVYKPEYVDADETDQWARIKNLADSSRATISDTQYDLTQYLSEITDLAGFRLPDSCYVTAEGRRIGITLNYVNSTKLEQSTLFLYLDGTKNNTHFDWSLLISPDLDANSQIKAACLQLTTSLLEVMYKVAQESKKARSSAHEHVVIDIPHVKREKPDDEDRAIYDLRKEARRDNGEDDEETDDDHDEDTDGEQDDDQSEQHDDGGPDQIGLNMTPIDFDIEAATTMMAKNSIPKGAQDAILAELKDFNNRLGKTRSDFRKMKTNRKWKEPGTNRKLVRARLRVGEYRVIFIRLQGVYYIDQIFHKDSDYR